MIKKIIAYSFIFAAGALFCGCSSVVTVAPSTTPITANDTYTKLGYCVGRAQSVIVIGLPFGSINPSKTARNDAIADKGGNALIEVTEEQNCINLLIVQYYWTTVEGTGIKFQRKGAVVE